MAEEEWKSLNTVAAVYLSYGYRYAQGHLYSVVMTIDIWYLASSQPWRSYRCVKKFEEGRGGDGRRRMKEFEYGCRSVFVLWV